VVDGRGVREGGVGVGVGDIPRGADGTAGAVDSAEVCDDSVNVLCLSAVDDDAVVGVEGKDLFDEGAADAAGGASDDPPGATAWGGGAGGSGGGEGAAATADVDRGPCHAAFRREFRGDRGDFGRRGRENGLIIGKSRAPGRETRHKERGRGRRAAAGSRRCCGR